MSCRGPPRGRAPPPACGPGRNPSSGTTMPAHRPRRLAHGRGQPKNRDTLPPTFPFFLLPEDSSSLSRLLPTPLESSRVCYCLRGAKKGVAVAAGGVAGLLRLRWPQGCREGAETVGLRPCGTGRIGPSRSRGRCPGVDGEAEAAATRRNKSSRTRPRPCAASLRRLGWVRGGCAPVVEPSYRRCSLPATHRPSVEVSSSAFCLVDTEHTSGLVESRRVEQIHVSRGGSGRRRQIWLQGHRGSGCAPGRWTSRGSFISPFAASVSCGSLQSFAATGSGGPWIRGDRFRRWLATLGGGGVGFTEVLGVWL